MAHVPNERIVKATAARVAPVMALALHRPVMPLSGRLRRWLKSRETRAARLAYGWIMALRRFELPVIPAVHLSLYHLHGDVLAQRPAKGRLGRRCSGRASPRRRHLRLRGLACLVASTAADAARYLAEGTQDRLATTFPAVGGVRHRIVEVATSRSAGRPCRRGRRIVMGDESEGGAGIPDRFRRRCAGGTLERLHARSGRRHHLEEMAATRVSPRVALAQAPSSTPAASSPAIFLRARSRGRAARVLRPSIAQEQGGLQQPAEHGGDALEGVGIERPSNSPRPARSGTSSRR